MKKYVALMALLFSIAVPVAALADGQPEAGFVRVDGVNLLKPDGEKLFIRGTNLGNWLNPEGYMFGFKKTNSPRMIDEMLRQLVGPEKTDSFWAGFKDNYITRKDIDYIAATGANTVRLPFHYKLFTNEDYLGLNSENEGFARVDSVISWCRDNSLYLILDMHDAPGGQTGDNIDDSYGYPWLFESEKAQKQFCDIWRRIATRYKDEPVILGYELINEPIAHFFENKEDLNARLEPLQKRAVESIRRVDPNHIILLGGAQWNSNFQPFTDWKYDGNLMYTCHRYGGDATEDAIRGFIDFRDRTGLPMYMGEIGHNTDQWQDAFSTVMEDNNIGYTFWPYKKKDGSCMIAVTPPAGWETIVTFAETPRVSYDSIRAARPDQDAANRILLEYLDAARLENCTPQESYIRSMHLTPRPLPQTKR